jgi:hypothetical protein
MLDKNLIAYFLVLFSDSLSFFYLIIKIYRILCFTKITCDQLPLINPYRWPISFLRIVTKPYFKFWSTKLPNLKLGKVSYDVSAILGLEILGSILYLCLQLRTLSFIEAEKLLNQISV